MRVGASSDCQPRSSLQSTASRLQCAGSVTDNTPHPSTQSVPSGNLDATADAVYHACGGSQPRTPARPVVKRPNGPAGGLPANAGLVRRPQWLPAHGSAGKQDDSIADGRGQSWWFPRTFPNPALADTVSCATLQAFNGPLSVSESPTIPITRMQVGEGRVYRGLWAPKNVPKGTAGLCWIRCSRELHISSYGLDVCWVRQEAEVSHP